MSWLLWSTEQTGRGPGFSNCASISTVSLLLGVCVYIVFHYKKCFHWSRKQTRIKIPSWGRYSHSHQIFHLLPCIFSSLSFLPMKCEPEWYMALLHEAIKTLCTVLQSLSSHNEKRCKMGKTHVHSGSILRDGSHQLWRPCGAEPSAHPRGTCK